MTEAVRPVLIIRPAVLWKDTCQNDRAPADDRSAEPSGSLYLLEVLTGDISHLSEVLVHEDENGGDDTEESTESEDDEVADALREGRLASEEGVLELVVREGGRELVRDVREVSHGGWMLGKGSDIQVSPKL